MFVHKVVLGGFQANGRQGEVNKAATGVCDAPVCALSSSNLSLMRSNYLRNTMMSLESVNRIKSELKS